MKFIALSTPITVYILNCFKCRNSDISVMHTTIFSNRICVMQNFHLNNKILYSLGYKNWVYKLTISVEIKIKRLKKTEIKFSYNPYRKFLVHDVDHPVYI